VPPSLQASDLQRLLLSDGVIQDRTATLMPLSGGVSSEIYLVNDGGRQFVVKRALPKLKVEQEWFADTSRNANEAACLSYIARLSPHNVPQLIYASAEHGYFCMEYLGAAWQNWKQMMLDDRCDLRIAQAAGSLLGRFTPTPLAIRKPARDSRRSPISSSFESNRIFWPRPGVTRN
jgi:5-methylthioribose kinase